MAEFAALLRSYRDRAGVTQRGLARASGINPAIISRLESGNRSPSGPEQVLSICRALRLGPVSADALLASAGFWPQSILTLGPSDETLLAVARVLTSDSLGTRAKTRFRRVVQLLARQWQVGGEYQQIELIEPRPEEDPAGE